MVNNVLNIAVLMRNEASNYKPKRGKCFKISKGAIQEEISFIQALVERHINCICSSIINENRSKKVPRTTILEADVIKEHGFVRSWGSE